VDRILVIMLIGIIAAPAVGGEGATGDLTPSPFPNEL
jgi:hypothetical protein